MADAVVAFHTLQLTSVHAAKVAAVRRPKKAADPEEPSFTSSGARHISRAAGEAGFSCTVTVTVDIPVLGDEFFHADVTMVAYFVSTAEAPLQWANARRFARAQAVYLLWPFARAYLDNLSMMTGVGVPPLPLLLVPRPGSTRQ